MVCVCLCELCVVWLAMHRVYVRVCVWGRIPYASTQYVLLCFMWLFLSLAIIGVYLSSYASDSCIACVCIVAFLQDGDFNLMIVARYLHWYNDDARPGTSMEAFLFFSYELL